MPNLIDDGVAFLANRLKGFAGTDVVIRRGARVSGVISGTLSLSSHEVIDEQTGIPTWKKSSDWVFTKIDLVIAGSIIMLRPGDLIETVVGARRFEVAPIANRPAVEPHDAQGQMVVVHTQEATCPTEC